MPKIILASTSPRRRELMQQLKLPFEVQAPKYEEVSRPDLSPMEEAKLFAREKALSLVSSAPHPSALGGHPLPKREGLKSWGRFLDEGTEQETLIIGCDTLVALAGEKLGKPQDAAHALEMLRKLSGKTHQVITAIAIVQFTNQSQKNAKITRNSENNTISIPKYSNLAIQEGQCVTQIKMRNFSEAEASAYVASDEPLGKAGAYAIQGKGRALIESIEGDFDNVVGLPLQLLEDMLKAGASLAIDKNS